MEQDEIYSLCEAVADIAYIAGQEGYKTPDSREAISNFISWAKEFENIYKGIQWGIDNNMDYIDAIYAFADSKLNS